MCDGIICIIKKEFNSDIMLKGFADDNVLV